MMIIIRNLLLIIRFLHIFLGNTALAKASRASVSGSKAGRILNFLSFFKLLKAYNVGKFYKNNEENIISKNMELFFEKKMKENLKNTRRKNMNILELEEKKTFFKKVHNVLNNPKIGNFNLRNSQINPKLIEKFYDIAMDNEKKNLTKNNEPNIISPEKRMLENTTFIKDYIPQKYKRRKTVLIEEMKKKENEELTEKFQKIKIKIQKKNTITTSTVGELKKINFNFNTNIAVRKFTEESKPLYLNLLKRKSIFETRREKIIEENENENSLNNENSIISEKKDKKISNKTIIEFKNYNGGSKPTYQASSIVQNTNLDAKHQNKHTKQDSNISEYCNCNDNILEKKFIKNSSRKFSLISPLILDKKRKSQFFSNDPSSGPTSLIPDKQENKVIQPKRKSYLINNNFIDSTRSINENKTNMNLLQLSNKQKSQVKEKNNDSSRYNYNMCPDCGKIISYTSIMQALQASNNNTIHTYLNEVDINSSSLENSCSVSHISSEDKFSLSKCSNIDLAKENRIVSQMNEMARKRRAFLEKKERALPLSQLTFKPMVSRKTDTFISNAREENKSKMLKFFLVKEENTFYTKLSLLFSKKMTVSVIFLILTMLFSSPLLDYESYIGSSLIHYEYAARYIDFFLADNRTNYVDQFIKTKILEPNIRNSLYPNLISIGFKNRTTSCRYFEPLCQIYKDKYFFHDNITFSKLRTASKIAFEQTSYIIIIYSIENYNKINSILTVSKIIFISFILWLGALMFLKDSNHYVVLPLEQISKKIENIQNNAEKLLFDCKMGIEEVGMKSKLEILNLLKFFKINTIILIKYLGLKTFSYFKNELSINKKQLKYVEPYEIQESFIMMIKLSHLEELNIFYQEKFTMIYSCILDILNLTIFEHFGEVISFDYDKIYCLWEINKNSNRIKEMKSLKNTEKVVYEEHDINKSFNSHESNKEEYEEFEVGKYHLENIMEFESNQGSIFEKINFDKAKQNINNLVIIAAIKLLSRLNYNSYIKEALNAINKLNLGIEIVIHKGFNYHLIINTDHKIETRYLGRIFSKVRYIAEKAKSYNLPIIITDDVNRELSAKLQTFTREILTIDTDNRLFDERISVYSFETVFRENCSLARYYYENVKITKDTSIIMKNEYSRMLNSNNFNIDFLFKNDSEILFSISKASLTFLKFYRESYHLFKSHRYEKSKKILSTAMIFKSDDFKSIKLMEEINERIKELESSIKTSSDESLESS